MNCCLAEATFFLHDIKYLMRICNFTFYFVTLLSHQFIGPRWASWNLGVFLCIRCAGIHRNLGVHISRVKSVNLDSWTPEQVVSLQQMGNSRARAVYEAQMPDGFRRPQTDSALETFIRAKYEQKKYVAREWVQPPPVKVNWDKEIDEEMEKQKRKKKGLPITSTATNGKSSEIPKSSTSFKSTPLPAPLPKPTVKMDFCLVLNLQKLIKSNAFLFISQTNSSSPKTSSRSASNNSTTSSTAAETKSNETKSYSSDLLGLSTPVNGPSATDTKGADNSNDIFGYFMSGTTNGNNPSIAAAAANTTTATVPSSTASNDPTKIPAETLAQQEHDFFNQVPNEKEKAKMTKDSILALYGQAPTIPAANQFMPGMQAMPTVDANGSLFGMPMQYQQQPQVPAFGMHGASASSGLNNFAQFGMMAPASGPQSAPQMNFQASHSINTMPNQSMGFSNVPSAMNPTSMQANLNKNNAFASGATSNNVNQQFGSLNLGNVWQ